jgi:hypothetical protein
MAEGFRQLDKFSKNGRQFCENSCLFSQCYENLRELQEARIPRIRQQRTKGYIQFAEAFVKICESLNE